MSEVISRPPHAWDAPSLTAHGKLALNRQIARDLTRRVLGGDLPVGAELPSESELAELYGVNRLTVRQALGDLTRQGLITTSRGRRATVAAPPVRYRLDQRPGTSLLSAMAEQGRPVGHDVLGVTTTPATDAPLPLDECDECVRYDYRRIVEGSPWSSSTTWIAAAVAPRAWSGERPVLDEVAVEHGLQIRRAVRMFAAVPASLDHAEALDVAVGTALLRVTGTSVDQHRRTIAVVRHLVLGDRAEYVINLIEPTPEEAP